MISLQRIAEHVGGQIHGDAGLQVGSLRSLGNATPDSLSFFTDPSLAHHLDKTSAAVLLISLANAHLFVGTKIIVDDPYLAYAKVSALFVSDHSANSNVSHSVSASAELAEGVVLAADVHIGAFTTIDTGTTLGHGVRIGNGVHIGRDVEIGEDTHIDDGVVIYRNCLIGSRCRISAGTVIGASGFGYVPENEKWWRIEQLAAVTIGNDVDIGANTAIDRGALENTVIAHGVKLDNLIHIAHNVKIGENTIIAAGVGVSGSTEIGRRCRIGGKVGIAEHLAIGDDVIIYGNGSVTKDIKNPGEYSSVVPVEPVAKWRRIVARVKLLDKVKRA